MPPRLDVATHPRVADQYHLLSSLAAIEERAAPTIIAGWHVHHWRHPHPAALLDPLRARSTGLSG